MTVFKPKQFGKYQLLDKIAVGGMAELYRAKLTGAEGFEKLIAIKKILPNLSEEENLITSFIDEAKLAALLHHENIVQIYDFGSMDDEYFIAMEFIFGKDLRTIRQTAKQREMTLSMENILHIVSRICAGLDYSHKLKDLQGQPLNIIHRDINPQNILVTYEGQVKIIDYGIAKAASQNTKTRENLIKGKLAYMSPEQANGQSIDHRSDIFSSGIILYELLAVKRMFEGETMHVLSLVREAQYDPPEEVIPDLPAKLNQILRRALAKDPAERYQSGGEMMADLEEFAFECSLRPNARSFANYMKALFEEELAEEELALWAKSKIYEAGDNDNSGGAKPPTGSNDITEDLTKGTSNERMPQVRPSLWGKWHRVLGRVLQKDNTNAAGESDANKTATQSRIKLVALKSGVVTIAFLVVVALGIKQISFSRSRPDTASTKTAMAADENPPEIGKITTAKTALEAKQYAQAVDLFEEIFTGNPSLKKELVTFYVNAALGQATDLIKTDSGKAEIYLLKALQIDPDNISGLSNLGYIYMDRQNYPKAIEAYLKVTTLAPRLPDTFFNLGYVYAVTDDYQQAKLMYQRVVELNPPFTDEALFNLAVINEKLGEYQQCIKNLERALVLNPGNESASKYLQQLKRNTGDKKG